MEAVIRKHDAFRKELDQAFEIVVEYLRKHQIAITGGQALDFMLRNKGRQLYDDDVVPDYDMMTPLHFDHARDLGQILIDSGIPEINTIRGLHPTTMRIRSGNAEIADFTYMPASVLDKLDYVEYNGLRVLGMRNMMVNVHRALLYPCENIPMTTMAHRGWKDMSRYMLLDSVVGVPKGPWPRILPWRDGARRRQVIPAALLKLKTPHAFTGYIPDSYDGSKAVFHTVELCSPQPEALLKELGVDAPTHVVRLMDWLGDCYSFNLASTPVRVYSTANEWMAVTGMHDICVVSPQGRLMYFVLSGDDSAYCALKRRVETEQDPDDSGEIAKRTSNRRSDVREAREGLCLRKTKSRRTNNHYWGVMDRVMGDTIEAHSIGLLRALEINPKLRQLLPTNVYYRSLVYEFHPNESPYFWLDGKHKWADPESAL
jgi:hypothetical protein